MSTGPGEVHRDRRAVHIPEAGLVTLANEMIRSLTAICKDLYVDDDREFEFRVYANPEPFNELRRQWGERRALLRRA